MNYVARVCPECGEQETHFSPESDTTTYCLNHEDEPGRTSRPAHVIVKVIPPAEIIQARRAFEARR